LEDVLEGIDKATARNDGRANKTNNSENNAKIDSSKASDSPHLRPDDILQATHRDAREEEAERPQRDLLEPSVVISTEAGKEQGDDAAHSATTPPIPISQNSTGLDYVRCLSRQQRDHYGPLYGGKLDIYAEREQPTPEGSPPTQPADMQPYSTTNASLNPDKASIKRSRLSTDTDIPHPKRSRRKRVETRKAREAREAREPAAPAVSAASAASAASFGSKQLGHAIPRYFRGKDWEIDDLDDVDLAEDGSVWCTVMWKPTRINAKALTGAAEKRLGELFTEKYGQKAWEMLMSQSTAGRRERGKKRRAE
jgi:hypothetical protein